MRFVGVVLSFVMAAPCSLAQQSPPPIPAKAFLPDAYDTILVADVAAMRARGVFDELAASAVQAMLPQIEKELGFPLEHLDRATLVVQSPRVDEQRTTPHRIALLEGNRELAIHDRITRGHYDEDRIGGRPCWRHREISWSVFAQPQPNVQVMGDEGGIVPILEGKAGTGVPAPDVMSLLSTRQDNLAYGIVACADDRVRRSFLDALFPDTKWPAGEAPTYLLLRAHCTGDADDPHVEVELVVRHAQAGPGLATSETAFAATVERVRKDSRLRMVHPLLGKLQKRVDRGDLCVTLDLGRMRDAVGQVATLFAAFVFAPGEEVRAQGVVRVPAPPPAPVPNPPQK